MRYVLDLHYVETALPEYVTDHHNGDDEQMFGVPVDRSSRMYHVRDALLEEIRAGGEDIPEEISEEEIDRVVRDAFKRVHPFKTFDHSLDRKSPEEYSDLQIDAYAWFVVTWSEVDDTK